MDESLADQEMQRQHDVFAAAIEVARVQVGSVATALYDARQFHPPHDHYYHDAHVAVQHVHSELRNLARIAALWGGQS